MIEKIYNRLFIPIVIIIVGLFLYWGNSNLTGYQIRILNLIGIYIGIALGLNLVNGLTGQFSLGVAGFMAIGAYTTAILTMSPQIKQMVYFIDPLISPLDRIQWGFLPALLMAGLLSGFAALLIGWPAFKFRDDYLAVTTLGFAEILRVIFTNTRSITNGALGLKAIPETTNLAWTWGFAIICVLLMIRLKNSNFGRSIIAIRENEVAAEAMGIPLFYYKNLAHVIAGAMAGVGGGLLGNLITTIDPNMFRFPLTFTVLLMVVIGGMGSITGTVIGATLVASSLEILRRIEEPIHILNLTIPGIPGMRMVIFAGTLVIVILFYRTGIMGEKEFSRKAVWNKLNKIFKQSSPDGGENNAS